MAKGGDDILDLDFHRFLSRLRSVQDELHWGSNHSGTLVFDRFLSWGGSDLYCHRLASEGIGPRFPQGLIRS